MIGRELAAGEGSERSAATHAAAASANKADERGFVAVDVQRLGCRRQIVGGDRLEVQLISPAVDVGKDIAAGGTDANVERLGRFRCRGDLNCGVAKLTARELLPIR